MKKIVVVCLPILINQSPTKYFDYLRTIFFVCIHYKRKTCSKKLHILDDFQAATVDKDRYYH